MKSLGLIIQREYISRVRTKSFILTTILTPILFIAVVVLPSYLMTLNESDVKKVYVIDNTGMYYHLFEASDQYQFIHMTSDDQGWTNDDPILQINADLSAYPKAATFTSNQQKPPRELMMCINDILTEAVKSKRIDDYTIQSKLDTATVANLQQILSSKDRIQVSTMRWDEDGKTSETLSEIASFVGMGLTFCMFFFIMMYGSMVMQSVVEEKSNRIVEVIISSVRPFDLMMGKIIGVGLTGLTQIAVWLGVGAVLMLVLSISFGANLNFSEMASDPALSSMVADDEMQNMVNGILQVNWFQIILSFVLYFIGGYLLFASLFAMFGSAANDSQEAQQFIMPVTILLMVAFYSGFAAAKNPEGTMAFWCSIIPFTSPIVMMVRTPFDIPIWELLLSLLLLFATTFFMIYLAGRIYRIGILMTGKKVSFLEVFKWISYK